ncbi:hypothetical protein DFJ58DRAFT_655738 [Suillus subalutaceus]|uniref:uncharacterized protein n=1 Tax=Suillus subalutaceus TaxID=48586 RepID=UPI001B86CF74|nr:uncharacterized protein DFJ58DRAFT_655738 [Suillus subalutaceus]KAG1864668.1 hypothetical protein DFJ58DRAFT_655738 [Suillus subalutaceus]
MPQQIHWTPFGIPYVVEFNNVSFTPRRTVSPSEDTLTSFPVPEKSASVSEQSLTYSCPSATSSSSSFCHISQCIHVDGLHIQFATPPCDPRASSRSRLVRLQKTITSAVVEAGMDTPSALEEQMDVSTNVPDYRSRDTLFRGTYGQVMVALKAAGLVATPCMEGEFAGATRLGALFVAHRSSEERNVQLRKLTLWG